MKITALASYEQALGLFRQVGDRLGEANCYLGQGKVALKSEEYENSLTLHTNAYNLYLDIRDGYDQAVSLYYRSFVYQAMSNVPSAVGDIETSLHLAESLDLPYADLFHERLEELRAL